MPLNVMFSGTNADDESRKYLKAIMKNIKPIYLIDVDVFSNTEDFMKFVSTIKGEYVLPVLPLDVDSKKIICSCFDDAIIKDIENVSFFETPPITITAEAILTELEKRKIQIIGTKVAVFNRSNVIGLPLTLELIKKCATVFNVNKLTTEEDVVDIIKMSDIVITATGKRHQIDKKLLKDKVVVDLSGDTDYEDSIKSVPTIRTLKKRWEKVNEN